MLKNLNKIQNPQNIATVSPKEVQLKRTMISSNRILQQEGSRNKLGIYGIAKCICNEFQRTRCTIITS